MSDTPAARSDALRNRARLLEAARLAFAESGTEDAALNYVARRAGVGPGTLWRHFPNRDALVAAVVGESLGELAELATGPDIGSAGDAVASWTAALVEHITRYRGLAATLIHAAADGEGPLGTRCREVERAAGDLLGRAREAGQVRADLSATELIGLATAIAMASESSPAALSASRLLELVFDGIRAGVAPG